MSDHHATQAAIDAFLRTESTLTLATRAPDGQPMAASLFFCSDAGLNVYWVSGPHSRHSRNLSADPRAALTVHAASWSWQTILGVQMEGAVAIVPPGSGWDAALGLYTAKFPFVSEFDDDIRRSNFYHFVPTWARLIDNGRTFGHKEEIILTRA